MWPVKYQMGSGHSADVLLSSVDAILSISSLGIAFRKTWSSKNNLTSTVASASVLVHFWVEVELPYLNPW